MARIFGFLVGIVWLIFAAMAVGKMVHPDKPRTVAEKIATPVAAPVAPKEAAKDDEKKGETAEPEAKPEEAAQPLADWTVGSGCR